MALTAAQWVRYMSTEDTSVLPDAVVTAFVADHSGESTDDQRKLALADCLEYMVRDDVYESYSRGGISVGKNRLIARAVQLRVAVGATIQTDELVVEGYDEESENVFA